MHTYKAHHTRVLASQTHMNDAVPSMITTELLLRCAFVTTGFPLDLHRRCIVGRSEDLFLRIKKDGKGNSSSSSGSSFLVYLNLASALSLLIIRWIDSQNEKVFVQMYNEDALRHRDDKSAAPRNCHVITWCMNSLLHSSLQWIHPFPTI